MVTKNKTIETEVDVNEFLRSYVDNEQKKQDSLQLIELMKKWSGLVGNSPFHSYLYLEGNLFN